MNILWALFQKLIIPHEFEKLSFNDNNVLCAAFITVLMMEAIFSIILSIIGFEWWDIHKFSDRNLIK